MIIEAVKWFLERAAEYSFSALASWDSFTAAIGVIGGTFTDLTSGLAWPYLLATLMIAVTAFAFSRNHNTLPSCSFTAFLFPRHVYRHPSAVLDYRFYIVSTLLKVLLWVPILAGIGLLGYKMMKAVLIGYALWQPPTTLPLHYLFGAVVGFYLFHDFMNYWAHVLLHKVPLLWSFHQVHHSAEVMTPITAYRAHPMEFFITGLLQAPVIGLAGVFYQDISPHDFDVTTIFGISMVSFMYGLSGFHLQHSHLPISYGPLVNRFIVSPIQHQAHHSIDARHHNKNFGVKFAIWDVLFNTLYIPRKPELMHYGLPDADPHDFSTVRKLYFLPFAKAMRSVSLTFQRQQTLSVQSPALTEVPPLLEKRT
jgi:sterol desaturase/sphingolipid hydroxylase (fatty acid hydroxylase superfamily)